MSKLLMSNWVGAMKSGDSKKPTLNQGGTNG